MENVGPYPLTLMALVDQLGCKILYEDKNLRLLKVPQKPGVRNFIVNPSFEYDLVGWHYWGEGNVMASNTAIEVSTR